MGAGWGVICASAQNSCMGTNVRVRHQQNVEQDKVDDDDEEDVINVGALRGGGEHAVPVEFTQDEVQVGH